MGFAGRLLRCWCATRPRSTISTGACPRRCRWSASVRTWCCEGLPAWAEDRIETLTVGPVTLRLVKPCTRCTIPSVDQLTGEPSTDPRPVLRKFRFSKALPGIMFGENAVIVAGGAGAAIEAWRTVSGELRVWPDRSVPPRRSAAGPSVYRRHKLRLKLCAAHDAHRAFPPDFVEAQPREKCEPVGIRLGALGGVVCASLASRSCGGCGHRVGAGGRAMPRSRTRSSSGRRALWFWT